MLIFEHTKKEVIHVFHNSEEEMHKNIQKLKEEGWSDNVRMSITGVPLFRMHILDEDEFKQKYPNVSVHTDEKSPSTFGGKYVYYTTHERKIVQNHKIKKEGEF
jgi:hypothetical protein